MGGAIPPELFQNKIVCEWLSSSQAAIYLGITENALRIMVCRGQVRAHKMGRRLRFSVDDLRALLTRVEVKR
ncbi:helix-turn-helix domain-containing protein [Bdellovibrio sp. HCB290]|uniref:helix-turn-helix domain-containing protein n=1 Tax=Bdellovibrio sp. HCB290 TaxID=3394356 RepID=UPI0039B56960